MDSRNYRNKLSQLNTVSDALTQAYRSFNITTDPVVSDCCIFQINALRERRNNLLMELRSMDKPNQQLGEYNGNRIKYIHTGRDDTFMLLANKSTLCPSQETDKANDKHRYGIYRPFHNQFFR